MLKTETKILISIFIFCLVLILGTVFIFSKDSDEFYAPVSIDYSTGEKYGNENAKVKVVEFSDFQCPACKLAEPFVKQVREKYKDRILFVYKHFPLMQHIHSKKAANFAEYAATEGKFWEVHDKLFETQDEWSNLSDPTAYFIKIGEQFNLDKNKIRETASKEPFAQKIDDIFFEGQKIGVDATPTFYLNGKKLKLYSFSDLDNLISKELSDEK